MYSESLPQIDKYFKLLHPLATFRIGFANNIPNCWNLDLDFVQKIIQARIDRPRQILVKNRAVQWILSNHGEVFLLLATQTGEHIGTFL